MSIFRKPVIFLFSIYSMLVFLAWLLILFPFALLSSLLGDRAGGNWMYRIVTFWADAAMLCWGMRQYNIYQSAYDPHQPVVLVFNHISYLDIPVLLKAFRRQPIRILGKAELAKVPLFGYIYRKAVILVQRDSAENRARSMLRLKRAI
ncbi:MAG TPA: lysophospholipid acyltransferase family protein, partial [Ferruginibacter sp.]|nr:lysophospholipid acyltransferase family protein [Ferruginibacter sp.]